MAKKDNEGNEINNSELGEEICNEEDALPETEDVTEDLAEDDDEDYYDDGDYPENLNQPKSNGNAKKIIIAISIAVIFIALILIFSFTNSGIIATYKTNFTKNMRRLFPVSEKAVDIGVTEKDSDVQKYVDEDSKTVVRSYSRTSDRVSMVQFEGASSGSFEAYGDGLVCTKTNYICFISGSGEIEWEQKTSVVNPMLSAAGKYIAIASENGTKLCLYEGEELLYECDTEGKIKSVSVSSKGDTVLVCDKANYKGQILVYNKDGQEIFVWASGKNNIIHADISSASRRVAATLLNAENNVYSIIKVFDINSKTDNVEMAFDDTILFKVKYTGDTITGFGDNSIVCVTSAGRVINDKRFDMVDIIHCAADDTGKKLIYFDSAGTPVFHAYSRKGALEHEIVLGEATDCIDIDGDNILYSTGREVMLRRAGSDRIKSYTATMDILELKLIDSKTYAIIHSNSIEIVRM